MDMSLISAINAKRSQQWHAEAPAWSYSDWAVALTGEVGELCNNIKKLNRIRDGLIGNSENLTKEQIIKNCHSELADIFLYLDLICSQSFDCNLEELVRLKFNAKSIQLGFAERL